MDATGGNILIEGGNITANGSVNNKWGAGIGTGVIFGGTATLGTITIKGGTVKATGGSEANGIGTGYTYGGCTNTIGTMTIYDGIDMVDASSIKNFNNVIYMHGETNVTASKSDYFTIGEDGNRRLIVQKPVIADIPDQTYTGSAITPEPLVIAGSLSLTKGTDYVYSYTNNTNVGTAKVRATFQGTYASLGSVEKEFTILPSTVMVSVTGSGTVTCGDRSATDGTSFGVMSEKGASVVLTLAPTDGYAARSVAYGYTNNSGTTASGIKLPISGTTAMLTVPDDLKDGTGVTVTVTFAPALNGGADETSAVALTDATVTDLGGGWYKVDSNITFDHTLNLLGDTHLIIADGKTMTVNTASNRGIYSDYTLFVSGAGALNVTTTSSGIAVCVGNYVQTGATVTASGYIGIRCKDDFLGFDFDNDFTFSGGQLTATGSGGGGIDADNDITLSCTNATDFIQASSYSSGYGAVKIADGKALTDGTEASNGMNGYSGTLTNEQRIAIGSKTLHRAVTTSYVDATGTLHENVIAIPLDNTMTTLAAGWYVVNENVDYTGKITLSGDVKLILGDGCTMSVTNTGTGNDDFAIYGDSGALHIYGQSQGTGALTATANSSIGINVDDYITINGGTVNVTSTVDVGIYGIDGVTINGGTVNAKGIYSDGDITINGGKVTATATSNSGICSNSGTIILGLRNATDYITAESYSGTVTIADGKSMSDGTTTYSSGTLTNEQKTDIAEKVLTAPTYGVTANRATTQDTDYWSTFYHPVASYQVGADEKAYIGTVNGNTVTLTEITDGIIPANTAVVLKATTDNFDLTRTATSSSFNCDGNELKGGSTIADGKVAYTLAAKNGVVGFYKFAGTLNPNKAHLEITPPPAQSAPAFFGFGGSGENTTAINEPESHQSHEFTGDYYTLDGRKLQGKPTQKGIYVRNGRKIIIK